MLSLPVVMLTLKTCGLEANSAATDGAAPGRHSASNSAAFTGKRGPIAEDTHARPVDTRRRQRRAVVAGETLRTLPSSSKLNCGST